MAVKLNLDPHTANSFRQYLQSSIESDAKTIDVEKEYILAKLLQRVMYRVDLLLLRYKQSPTYRIKTIQIDELEVMALVNYFTRYQLHPFLLPLQQEVMESIRFKFPQIIETINKRATWQNFLTESDFAS